MPLSEARALMAMGSLEGRRDRLPADDAPESAPAQARQKPKGSKTFAVFPINGI
jgi:hypothetical protein